MRNNTLLLEFESSVLTCSMLPPSNASLIAMLEADILLVGLLWANVLLKFRVANAANQNDCANRMGVENMVMMGSATVVWLYERSVG
mmetsp:Transcript_24876/g.38472  ORF Transcript_24876/g.38472 Transcript_24876/m.38472 type:complete len:87 (+) Transcript_24876:1094-1354(+)